MPSRSSSFLLFFLLFGLLGQFGPVFSIFACFPLDTFSFVFLPFLAHNARESTSSLPVINAQNGAHQVATPSFAAPPAPRCCVIVTLAASSPAVADIAIHRPHRPSPVPSPALSRLCPGRCCANVPSFSDAVRPSLGKHVPSFGKRVSSFVRYRECKTW
ncbi:hypothetical protein AAHA92_22020 [Salvia divinorum]|uniref:Secreted protein n=1 Tax=Salvia divinorum TaxID=28513 RepID=A0ABD1GMB3_SALDI